MLTVRLAPPPITLDITRLVGRFLRRRLPTGIDRVGLAYVEHYGDRARALLRWGARGAILSEAASRRMFERLLCARQRYALNLGELLSQALFSRERRPLGGFLFNTGHMGLEKLGYGDWARDQAAKPLYLVHDLIPIEHPEYCRTGERERHERRIRAALASGAGIVANSSATLLSIQTFARHAGLAMPPAIAAPLAPGVSLRRAAASAHVEPYFVMLGTIEPRKNHWLILQVWRSLIAQWGTKAPRLVIVGQRGWNCQNVVDLLERCETLRGFVVEMPHCGDDELANILGNARALLFPSFAEGYGLPVVEALAAGVPVIASDLSALRETSGDTPEYLDPLDGIGWRRTILNYADPCSPMRAKQLARLCEIVLPSWRDHFSRVDAFLDELQARQGRRA